MIDTTEAGRLPRADVTDKVRNYAVWEWHSQSRSWLFRGRFGTPQEAAVHDWRDLQRIKNELVGPEHEAVELYPAESRLVDGANQYHLFVLADAEPRFPFGFNERFVSNTSEHGCVQRPFPPSATPPDCMTTEEYLAKKAKP